ncbi:MAG: amidohydrolase family protein [Chitinophagaceae bacterium]|nr:amidohydrolase family protein [Chitinophagaceae bacterium]
MERILLLLMIVLSGCKDNYYDDIKKYIDSLKIVDSHEHQRTPGDSADFRFFNTSYFENDLRDAGLRDFDRPLTGGFNTDSLWEHVGKYYNYSRALSSHAQMMNYLRILYGYDKPYVEKSDLPGLYRQMIANHYKNYNTWFDKVYHEENFETMLQDQYWDRFNTNIDTDYFKLVCNVHECISLVGEAATNKKIVSSESLLRFMGKKEVLINNLDDYTNLIDTVLNTAKRKGAVCIKNTAAYFRTLEFEDVDSNVARGIFDKSGALTAQDKKKLEDYVFHNIIKRSIDLDLPIQIHTGYLAGLGSRIDNGQPMKLINLFIRYPTAKFMLFHGGYPWTGDFVVLGKQFSNVYLDLVWLPQLSMTSAIYTLHEMLDAVPYNKILWGGDVGRIDDAVGSLELAKEVVATVLSERVEKGWMTKELAHDIAKHIFHDNAIELFHLKLHE